MPTTNTHRPHHRNDDVPDESEPGSLPVEPDEGPVPAHIPDDPERDRMEEPAGSLASPRERDGPTRSAH